MSHSPPSNEGARTLFTYDRRAVRVAVKAAFPRARSDDRENFIWALIMHAKKSGRTVDEVVDAVIPALKQYSAAHPHLHANSILRDASAWLDPLPDGTKKD